MNSTEDASEFVESSEKVGAGDALRVGGGRTASDGFGLGGRALVVFAALIIFLAGLKLASTIVVPLLLAIFVAIATAPVVTWLTGRGVHRILSVVIAFAVDLAALALFGSLVAAAMRALSYRLPNYQARLGEVVAKATEDFSLFGYELTAEILQNVVDPGKLFELASATINKAAGMLTSLILVLLLVLFMLFEASGLRDKLLCILKSPEANLGPFARTAVEMQKYLAVKTASSMLTGVLVGVWLLVLDVDLALLWGLLAFALNFIPTLGSIIAAVPPMLVTILVKDVGDTLVVLAGYIAVNFSIGNFLEPRILGRTLGLSPLIVVLSVVFWGWLLGPVGALLAVPLTMVAKIFLANTEDLRWIAVILGPSSEALTVPKLDDRAENSSA